MNFKSYVLGVSTVVVVTAFMSGCNRHLSSGSANREMVSAHACSTNPYLSKYSCSISRVQRAAESGNPDAQYALGYMYYYGIDTVEDQQTATLWIKRAANQDQPLAKKAWTLIKSNANFKDLHQASFDAAAKDSREGSTIVQQKPSDVTRLNAVTQDKPITHHLPAYHDPRLANNAVPTTAVGVEGEGKSLAPSSDKASDKEKPTIANAEGKYTMQLMASDQLSDVKNFMTDHHLSAQAKYYRTKLNGKPWYMLTYGSYDTEAEAITALRNLPQDMQAHHPWVKSWNIVKKEVRLQKVIG